MTAPASGPTWLPAYVPFSGDWNGFVRTLYAIFEMDFKAGTQWFHDRPLWHDRRILADDPFGYEEGFWHLVTSDQWRYDPKQRRKVKERLPEIGRAERLPWARPITRNDTDAHVVVWDFEDETTRGKAIRTYLWLKDLDYVVILERQSKAKGDIFMLITSFYVDRPSKQKDLESRYARRLK